MDDLAEVAIERELAAVGAGLEGQLFQALELLKSYSPADLDQNIRDFAKSEVEIEDSFKLAAFKRWTSMEEEAISWNEDDPRRPPSSRHLGRKI